jgi:hypothetical protein
MIPALAAMELKGTARLDFRVTSPASAKDGPQIDGTVTLASAGAIATDMPTITGLNTTIRMKGDQIDLPASQLEMGGSPATIEAHLRNLADPNGTFSLKAARLTPSSIGAAALGKEGDVLEHVVLDARLDPKSKVSGLLTSRSGKLSGAAYQNLSAKFSLVDGVAQVSPLQLQAFGGSVNANGSIELSGKDDADFALKLDVDNVALAQTAGWLAPTAAKVLSGTIGGKLALNGRGNTWKHISSTLAGTGSLRLAKGRLENINIAEEVLGSMSSVPGLSSLLSPSFKARHPALFKTGATEFDDLVTGITMTNGRIRTEDLRLKTGDYAIAAKGTLGLDQSVDLAAHLIASKDLTRDLIGEVSAMKYLSDGSGNITIPFALRGNITTARPALDTQFVANSVKKALIGSLTDQLLRPRN